MFTFVLISRVDTGESCVAPWAGGNAACELASGMRRSESFDELSWDVWMVLLATWSNELFSDLVEVEESMTEERWICCRSCTSRNQRLGNCKGGNILPSSISMQRFVRAASIAQTP